jgi:hypothetical protein
MKTAVEWLIEELEMNILWTDKARKVVKQANKMFEEQIMDAWLEGNSTECDADGFAQSMEMEQYYNETFKSE